MAEVAHVCNRYPDVELSFAVENETNLTSSDPIVVIVQLERDIDESAGAIGPVPAPLFPKEHTEGWWLVVAHEDTLLGIKKVAFGRTGRERLEFMPPAGVTGQLNLKLYLMSDCFLGADQEFDIGVNVQQGDDDEEDDQDGVEPMDTK